MKHVLAVLLAIAVALHIGVASIRHPVGPQLGESIHGPTTEIDAPSLRVATWNIRRGKGLDGERDLDRIASHLDGFDIIGLNEVGGALPWAPWSNDQAAQLGRELDMGWQFMPSQRRWYVDHFGNALLSRLSPVRWRSDPIVYDRDKATGHRHLQTVIYDWHGTRFAVIILHAETGPIHAAQIEAAMDRFDDFEHAILMGDFNSTAKDEPIAAILADPDVASVLDAADMIDWIFVRGFEIADSGLVPAGPSDHPLVWGEIEPRAIETATP